MKKMNTVFVSIIMALVVVMLAIPAFAGSVDCDCNCGCADCTCGVKLSVLENELSKSAAAEKAQSAKLMAKDATIEELQAEIAALRAEAEKANDPWTYDENGIPVSIDFEDAMELLKVEVSTGKYAYRIGTGIDIKVTDEVDLVSMKPYVDEYFMFAHADWSAYSFTGITSDGAMGTFTLGDANGKVYPYAAIGSDGYSEKETEKILGGTSDLELCLGAAMKACQTKSGKWIVVLAANGYEYVQPVAKQNTTVYVEKEVPVVVERTVEKEVPVVVEKTIEKEVPVVVEKTVEKEVPVVVEKTVEKEVPVVVEKTVEKEVPVVVEKTVEKEVVKEVPVEVVVEKEVVKEVPVEVVVEKEVIVYRDRPTPEHSDDNDDDDEPAAPVVNPEHNDKNNENGDNGYDEPEVINDGGNAVEEVEKTLDELNNGSHNEGNNDYDEPEVVDDGGNAIEEVEKTLDELSGNHNGNNDDDDNVVNHNSSNNEDNDVTSPATECGSAIDAVQEVIPEHNGNNDD